MPVINAKPLSKYPWFVRIFFWKQKRTYGRILAPAWLWGRSPLVFASVALLYGALNRKSSPLTPALRSLITVRVSQINCCAFCVDINSATLIKCGVSIDKIGALDSWRNCNLFDAAECLALEYVEAITITGRGVDDNLRERLRHQWGDDAIIDLTALIAFQNLSSKFNAALGVPPQGFCIVSKQNNLHDLHAGPH